MQKHQLGRDTRGPSAPKHKLPVRKNCSKHCLLPGMERKEIPGEERKGNMLMSSFQSYIFPPSKWAADSDFMSERLALVSRFIKLHLVLCPRVSGLVIL